MEAFGQCPYCGETISILVDPGGASMERYVEDCEVCCRPIAVTAVTDAEGESYVQLARLDD